MVVVYQWLMCPSDLEYIIFSWVDNNGVNINSKHTSSLLLATHNKQLKLGLTIKKQPTNKLKMRILSETSIPYLIRHASFFLIVGLHL